MQLDTPAPNDDLSTQTAAAPLVRHTVRGDWGRALFLWHREEKRAYQFEDGKMRVFADRFAGLLRPAARPDPVLRHRLRQRATADGHLETKAGPTKTRVPTPTVDDQATVFENVFEGGFHGTAWVDSTRARPGKKSLKRHRDAAIEAAHSRLGLNTLRAYVEAGTPQRVMDEVLSIVGSTDLATRQQIQVFESLDVDLALAGALIDFLYDVPSLKCGPTDQLRLELARKGLRKVPWTTVTAARALIHPSEHAYIRPSVFRAQLKLVAPSVKLSGVPTPETYGRCLEVALQLKAELELRGFRPRDLFDVTGFMRVTTAKKHKDALVAAMAARSDVCGVKEEGRPTPGAVLH